MESERIEMEDWSKFYAGRVNSSYQDYFEERYKVMLEIIASFKPQYVLEEGIGIGSISKALNKLDIFSYGFDNSIDMLRLCQQNNKGIYAFCDDILNPSDTYYNDLIVTHGVLEHFNNLQIERIVDRYKANRDRRIHYVPLDAYKTPSFGDERLLPFQYWLNLVRPKDYILFNNHHDLLLIN